MPEDKEAEIGDPLVKLETVLFIRRLAETEKTIDIHIAVPYPPPHAVPSSHGYTEALGARKRRKHIGEVFQDFLIGKKLHQLFGIENGYFLARRPLNRKAVRL